MINHRFFLTYLLVLVTLVGCQQKEDKLHFEPLVLTEKECSECPEVHIAIPKAIESTRTANSVNTALREEIISQLHFNSDQEIVDLDDALLSFQKEYSEISGLYPEANTPWEARFEGEVVYEDKEMLTLQLNSYIFTGGAHGYGAQRFLNFDKKRGVELENWQLFQNRKAFEQFVEAKFREQEAIPPDASINDTGLMFESDRFHLPENIGFTKEGVKLLYNPYEVASYADGLIELTLPFREVKPYLAVETKS